MSSGGGIAIPSAAEREPTVVPNVTVVVSANVLQPEESQTVESHAEDVINDVQG